MSRTISFVTGNKTKVLHAQTALLDTGIAVVQKKADMIEPREEAPEKIVIEKARQAMALLNEPVMVEDSGIFIEALNGFPKTFVKFAENTIGIEGILKMMEDKTNRKAEFRQALAYFEPGMAEPKVFSYIDGDHIVAKKVWESDNEEVSEFDKILIPPGEEKPLCCFSREWRARRDAEANKDRIHYQQLAKWLMTR